MLRPIAEVAEELSLRPEHVIPYGRGKAKVDLAALGDPRRGRGRVILVSAINPTPGGEGKTTVSVGLAMGLRALGRRAVCALREPSLGPVFGVKGGGTGGGRAQLEPATDINLHFTGDLHAIGSANNLLAAMVDNAAHFGQAGKSTGLDLDPRRITWRRCIDMNDRALRRVVTGLSMTKLGAAADGVPRETGFDITAASEVMAILCLARDRGDLLARLNRIVVGFDRQGRPITAGDVGAATAMAALLQDAIMPNLVQTREGGPAWVHGGPFANIAHGCSSVLATRMASHVADDVVTEAGFGFDLGAEKFFHIKCRSSGLWPSCVVVVVTLRALRFHGGQPASELDQPSGGALERGLANLDKHLETARAFGVPAVVAINQFASDTEQELQTVHAHCRARQIPVQSCRAFAEGGAGSTDLARVVAEVVDSADEPRPRFLYALDDSYEQKLHAVATRVYGADGVHVTPAAAAALQQYAAQGFGQLPVCIAKTHLSLSDDARVRGRPEHFVVTVRDVRLSAGAGFVVALLGDIATMPGLPQEPAARRVSLDTDGRIRGLMQNDHLPSE
jgi:formate--tetrahydrofolate ligase